MVMLDNSKMFFFISLVQTPYFPKYVLDIEWTPDRPICQCYQIISIKQLT